MQAPSKQKKLALSEKMQNAFWERGLASEWAGEYWNKEARQNFNLQSTASYDTVVHINPSFLSLDRIVDVMRTGAYLDREMDPGIVLKRTLKGTQRSSNVTADEKEGLATTTFLLLEVDNPGNPLGFLRAYTHLFPTHRGVHFDVQVDGLYVRPLYRGNSHGTELALSASIHYWSLYGAVDAAHPGETTCRLISCDGDTEPGSLCEMVYAGLEQAWDLTSRKTNPRPEFVGTNHAWD